VIRPAWEEIAHRSAAVFILNGFVKCPCGKPLYTKAQVRQHFEAGHFDEPETLGVSVSDGIRTEDKAG